MDHERHWRIRDALGDALRNAYGRHGTTARDRNAFIDVDGGDVVIRRDAVGFETQRRQPTQGPRILHPVKDDAPAAIIRAADRFADLHMALIARERCIADHGGGVEIPAWSVLGDALLAKLVGTSGLGAEAFLTLATVDGGNRVANDDGFGLPRQPMRLAEGGGTRYSVTFLGGWLSGGVAGAPFKIRNGLDGTLTYDGKRSPTLTVIDQTLPDTLLAGLGGHAVDKVVAHPLLDGAGATVSSAKVEPGAVPKLHLRLRRHRTPFAPAPEGVDASWLAVIDKLTS